MQDLLFEILKYEKANNILLREIKGLLLNQDAQAFDINVTANALTTLLFENRKL